MTWSSNALEIIDNPKYDFGVMIVSRNYSEKSKHDLSSSRLLLNVHDKLRRSRNVSLYYDEYFIAKIVGCGLLNNLQKLSEF